MNIQPTLYDSLIALIPLKPEDLDELYEAASDPLIWQQHPNSDRYKRDKFEEYFQKAIESKGAFKVLDLETNRVVGCTRYYDLDIPNSTVKIGYTFLIRKCWGQAYNPDMKNLLIEHAFNNVDTVLFEVAPSNLRSRKALEKIGAQYDSDTLIDGQPHQVYKISKSSW